MNTNTATFTQQATAPIVVPCATVVEYESYTTHHGQPTAPRRQQQLEATHLGSLRTVNNKHNKPDLVHIPSSNVIVDANSSSSNYHHSYTTAATAPTTAYATTDYATTARRTFRGRPVKAKNAHLPDSILAFKKNREAGTAVATWASGVTGLILLGPLGALIGASAAYGVTKSVGKRRERKLIALHQGQQQAASS